MTWQFRPTTFSCRSSLPVRYQMLSYCFSVRRRTPTVPVPGECSDNRRMCFSAVFRLEVIRIYSSVPIRRYPSETRKLRRSVYAFFCPAFVRGSSITRILIVVCLLFIPLYLRSLLREERWAVSVLCHCLPLSVF